MLPASTAMLDRLSLANEQSPSDLLPTKGLVEDRQAEGNGLGRVVGGLGLITRPTLGSMWLIQDWKAVRNQTRDGGLCREGTRIGYGLENQNDPPGRGLSVLPS